MKKTKIEKILIPTDFSDTSKTVVAEAMALAQKLKAEVCLMHVTEAGTPPLFMDPKTPIPSPPMEQVENEINRKMSETAKKLSDTYGITPSVYLKEGDIHDEIIEFAEKNDIDLIAMGTHGASGYRELFVGSNAQRVVTVSEIPVLTVQKQKPEPGFKNILVPIDDSVHSREKVNIAMLIADLFKAKLHIVGLPDSDDTQEMNKFKIKLESVEKLAKAHELPFVTTIVHGDSLAETALEYANDKNCDLIVINTGHESKLTGMFLGAFAQQIVNHSRIPVLSFRHRKEHYTIDTPGFGV